MQINEIVTVLTGKVINPINEMIKLATRPNSKKRRIRSLAKKALLHSWR